MAEQCSFGTRWHLPLPQFCPGSAMHFAQQHLILQCNHESWRTGTIGIYKATPQTTQTSLRAATSLTSLNMIQRSNDPQPQLFQSGTSVASCGILWDLVAFCGMWSYVGKSAIFLGGCCSGAAAATFLRAEERRRQVKAGEYYQMKGRAWAGLLGLFNWVTLEVIRKTYQMVNCMDFMMIQYRTSWPMIDYHPASHPDIPRRQPPTNIIHQLPGSSELG